jgi:hypothetical protein
MEPAKFLKQHRVELVRYDHMIRAIAECERFDEVKDLRDEAHALEVYAAQSLNYEAETKAAKIRVRAERRCGQLIKEGQLSGILHDGEQPGPGRGKKEGEKVSSRPTPLSLTDLGVSRQQSSDRQAIAELPEEQFEARLNDPSLPKPTTPDLAEQVNEERLKINEAIAALSAREEEPSRCIRLSSCR